MRRIAGILATAAGWLSRRLGRGGGTTIPGVVLLRLRPNAIAEMAGDLPYGSVLCSATNGKTTTTRLITAAVESQGVEVLSNAEGSNLERGIAAAMLRDRGRSQAGVFEVDEAALDPVARATRPEVVLLMNLFRDQLDRYGELETLVDRWSDVLTGVVHQTPPATAVLNADDPNIAEIGRRHPDTIWFGVDAAAAGRSTRAHAADAITCRRCGGALAHDLVFVGHLGHWRCTRCEASRPHPDVRVVEVERGEHRGQRVTLRYRRPGDDLEQQCSISSPLSGLHNAYNIAAAFAATLAFAKRRNRHFDDGAVATAIGNTGPAFGRDERIEVDGRTLRLLLAKNPTGVNQNVHTLLAEGAEHHVLVLLNDRTADGQDVSWIWDVDWEQLDGSVASLTLGGDRAWDLALRFRYGGFDMQRVHTTPGIADALDRALGIVPAGQTLQVLPTYTSMLDLRAELTRRGHAAAFWEPQP